MPAVGVLGQHATQFEDCGFDHVGTDWRTYDIIAADPEHLSCAIGRVLKEGLSASIMPLTGVFASDLSRLRAPSAPRKQPTLRIFNSGQPARQHGFRLGLGALFHTVDHARAGVLSALRGALDVVPGQMHVDGESLGDGFALAGVSANTHFPLRLSSPVEPGPDQVCYVWNNLDGSGWFRQALSLMKGVQNLPSHRAGVAKTVRFEIQDTGYSLDGALYVAEKPCILSVTRGPDIMVST